MTGARWWALLLCSLVLSGSFVGANAPIEEDEEDPKETVPPAAPPKVLSLEPDFGYTVGDDLITIHGENFPDLGDRDAEEDEDEEGAEEEATDEKADAGKGVDVFCLFGKDQIDAEEVYPTYITCKTPPHSTPEKVILEVKIGDAVTANRLSFEYKLPPDPVFKDYTPKDTKVSYYGGEVITVTGENFGTWDDQLFRCRFVTPDGKNIEAEVTDIEESEISCVVPEIRDPSAKVYVEMSRDKGESWDRVSDKMLEFMDPCEEYETCRECVMSHCGYCFHNNLCQTVAENGLFRRDPDTCTLDKWVHVKGDCSKFEGAITGPSARSKLLGAGALFAVVAVVGTAFFLIRRGRRPPANPRDDRRPLIGA